MSSSNVNVFNNYNRVLLRENLYNYKFNPYKRETQRRQIVSLYQAIKNNDNNYELNTLKQSDSLTTIDAMNNPYMLKFTEEEKNPYDVIKQNNRNTSKRNKTAQKRTVNKGIDIQRYSDCIKFSELKKRKIKIDYCLWNSNNRDYKKKLRNFITNSAKLRPLSFKKSCAYCKEFYQVEENKNKNKNEKFDKILEQHLNIYNNKNFKDTLSCFIYHINNFTSKKFENEKESLIKSKKINLNMISEFTKDLKKKKFKEIQRTEFDPSNLYFIQKPLIPTIRGKILRNMKKRYHKPIRNVVTAKNRETLLSS